MEDSPRLLLADDEKTFLMATAELLRQEGYYCDTALDAPTAASMLRSAHYDVLIADIKMPGNPNLELIKQVARSIEGLPVIIVTGNSTLETAVDSLDLPVWGYLIKPLDFDALLQRIRIALQFRHQYNVVHNQRRRTEELLDSVDIIESMMVRTGSSDSQVPVETFIALTMRNIRGALDDLQRLVVPTQAIHGDACHLLECPRPARLLEALRDTITVLEKTKSAFKSKELGALRERLEKIVTEAQGPQSFRKPPAQDQTGGEEPAVG
jgi:DNA-binding response OmpR family regulator